jgi:hypothetical protein
MRLRRNPLMAIATAVLSAGALTAALLTTGTAATAEPASTAEAATTSHAASFARPAGVPWSHVGPGWVLTQYVAAVPEGGKPGPVTLYLISPTGARYQLAHWPDSRTAPSLVAWSPDGKRALFQVFSGQGRAEQLTLATGQMTTFVMQGDATPIGYTTPRGLNILASRPSDNDFIEGRYSLSGRLLKSLGSRGALYTPSGTEFAAGASHGLKLVSNRGPLIKQLPVPGTAANTCGPVRWWDSGTILASCARPAGAGSRLWLVPVSGTRPRALTRPHDPRTTGDFGDLDAWQRPGHPSRAVADPAEGRRDRRRQRHPLLQPPKRRSLARPLVSGFDAAPRSAGGSSPVEEGGERAKITRSVTDHSSEAATGSCMGQAWMVAEGLGLPNRWRR